MATPSTPATSTLTSLALRPRDAAKALGIHVIPEVYFDLGYDARGQLVLQRKKVALDLDDLKQRLTDYLATGEIVAVTGERVRIDAESVCVHGDGPNAVDVARTIREVLTRTARPVAAIAE